MTAPTLDVSPTAPAPRAVRRTAVALAVLALVALGPVVARQDASSWSRLAFTGALVDDRSVDVTDYPLGLDHVVYEGERRSDKAPGQPLLAAPFYAVSRAVGGEPAVIERTHENLTLWWQTLWMSVIPFSTLLVLMYLSARRVDERAAVPATLAIGFGTLLLPFADHLYGHVLAALCAFAAWLLVREAPTPRRAAGAGALAAFATITEYQVALIALVIAVALAMRARDRLVPFALGAAPFALVAAVYHWIAVGHPLRVPYSLKPVHESGIVGISYPRPDFLGDIFFGDRGFLVATPIVLVALVGAIVVARTPGPWRADAAVGLASFVALVCVQAGGSMPPWGGESPGPRYVVAAMPFLVVPLTAVWARCRPLTPLVAAWSIGVMLMPTFTQPLLAEEASAIPTWLRLVGRGEFAPTILSMAGGIFGALIHVGAILVAVVHLARVSTQPPDRAAVR